MKDDLPLPRGPDDFRPIRSQGMIASHRAGLEPDTAPHGAGPQVFTVDPASALPKGALGRFPRHFATFCHFKSVLSGLKFWTEGVSPNSYIKKVTVRCALRAPLCG